jgi:hypothetical protein
LAQVVAFCSGSAEIGFVSQFFAQGFERFELLDGAVVAALLGAGSV